MDIIVASYAVCLLLQRNKVSPNCCTCHYNVISKGTQTRTSNTPKDKNMRDVEIKNLKISIRKKIMEDIDNNYQSEISVENKVFMENLNHNRASVSYDVNEPHSDGNQNQNEDLECKKLFNFENKLIREQFKDAIYSGIGQSLSKIQATKLIMHNDQNCKNSYIMDKFTDKHNYQPNDSDLYHCFDCCEPHCEPQSIYCDHHLKFINLHSTSLKPKTDYLNSHFKNQIIDTYFHTFAERPNFYATQNKTDDNDDDEATKRQFHKETQIINHNIDIFSSEEIKGNNYLINNSKRLESSLNDSCPKRNYSENLSIDIKSTYEVKKEKPAFQSQLGNSSTSESIFTIKSQLSTVYSSSNLKDQVNKSAKEVLFDHSPIVCPITLCNKTIFISDSTKHIKIDHRQVPIKKLCPKNISFVFLDPRINQLGIHKCHIMFLVSDKIVKFGSNKYSNYLPVLVMSTRISILDFFANDERLKNSKHFFLMVWLIGLNTSELPIYYSLSALSQKKYKISHSGQLLSLRSSQKKRDLFNSGKMLLLSENQCDILSHNGKHMIEFQIIVY